jgi:hypothetical protein
LILSTIGPRNQIVSIDRFYRTPAPLDEWRARAREIQSQLEGLTIAELMRGTTKHRWAENHDGYDHNQPRVPAGHPDGGQWTKTGTSSRRIGDIALDETPDEDWIPGADLAARGHHWMPREFYLRFPFTRETRKVFRDATSGTLPHRIYSEDRFTQLRHRFDHAHRQYNAAVYELIKDYMKELNITPQQMTPDQAREFLRVIDNSNNPRIRRYNAMIRFMNQMFRLRSGGRGNE